MKMFKRMFSAFVAVFAAISAFAATPVTTEAELKSALASGGEVTLGADIALTETIQISSSVSVSLDLGGYDITAGSSGYVLENTGGGKLTLSDSVSSGEVKGIVYTGNGSETVVDGGTYTAIDKYVFLNSSGVLTINKATVNGFNSYPLYSYNEGHKLVVNDVTVNGVCGCLNAYGTGGEVIINGGTFNYYGREGNTYHIVYVSSGTVTINGGTFRKVGDVDLNGVGGGGVCAAGTVKLTVNGGTFEGAICDITDYSENNEISIRGGVFANLLSGTDSVKADCIAVDAVIVNKGTSYIKSADGTLNEATVIDSVEKLKEFATAVNDGATYEGQTVVLAADLDVSNEKWSPIGNGVRSSKSYSGNAFKGVFNGCSHTISGLTITSTTAADAAIGLFGIVDGGTVKNLKLDDVNINVANSDLAGGAIGMMLNGATAENITVGGAVVGYDGVGGIVGRMIISGTISACTNNASVTSSYGGIGGIVGKAYYEDGANTALFASINGCVNNGTITAPMYMGGIVGLARANVTGCINNGAVVGGTQTGGIVGQLIAAGTVSGNENAAKITGKNHMGGIIGDYTQSSAYTYYNVTIADNINRGELAATEQCAAIMGCNNIDGFTAMTASGNVSYYYVDGLALFGNPEDMVIDDTNRFASYAAQIGDVKYETIEKALDAAVEGDEIVLLADVNGNVNVPAKVVFNGNGHKISGIFYLEGDVTIKGYVTASKFGFENVGTVINIPAGATLELNGSDRMVIGHGCTFNITGTIADAKTADVAELTPSLIAPGASFTGAGVTFNVDNAYVKFTVYCSSKNSNASDTFNFNVTNSIWEQIGSLAFSEPTSGMDPTINFNLKDSILNSTSHLVFAVAKGEIVFDNSNVNVGTSRQIENRSTMTVKNGSVVNGAVATSSNAKNPGTLIIDNATYAVSGEFSGSDLGTGTLIVKNDASFTAGKVTKADIQIDATGMSAGDSINITADLSNFAGTLEVVNNDSLVADIVDGKIVLALKPVAKIGEVEYTSLQTAIEEAQDGETVVIFAGEYGPINISSKNINIKGTLGDDGELLTTIKGGNPAITGHSFNGTIQDLKIVDAWKVMYAEPAGNVVVDNVYVTGATYGFHLVAYSPGLTWTIQNSYMDLRWANSFGVYDSGDADIIIKGNTFEATDPYYPDYGALHVNSFLPKVTVEENIFGENAKINIDSSVSDTSNINISKNYHADGVENAFADDSGKVGISQYYTGVAEDGTLTGLVTCVAQIGDTYYETLQAAVDAAVEGDVITMLDNVTQTDGVRITDKKLTINLNETTFTVTEGASTVSRNLLINGSSVVTVSNGTMVAAGDYSSGAYGTVRTEGTANATLTGLNLYNYRGNGLNIKACSGTTVAISDTEVYSQYGGGIEAAGGTITVDDVIIEQKGLYTAPYNSMAISVNGGGKVTVNGGNFSTECLTAEEANNQGSSHGPWVAGVLNSGGTLIINGGTFSNDNFGDNSLATYARGAILADTGAEIKIKGGNFNALAKIIDIQNNLGDASKNPTGTITGGTFSADPTNDYVVIPEDYYSVKQPECQLWKVGKLPNAEVVNMGPTAITEYSIYNGSSLSDGVTPINLQIALDFVAKDTPAAAADNAYGQYTTDFYISIDGAENGSFVADGCYLAGNYGTFGWIMIPLDGMEIKNGEVYPVISSVGFDFSYEDICTSVKDFKCGIYFSPEVLAQNPNLTVSLNLGLSETVDQAKSAEFTSAIEEPFTYDVEDMTKAVAIAGPDYYTTVADAVEAALQTGDFVKLVADANLDRDIEISSDLVINLNGKTLSADGKALTITDSIMTITNGTLSAFSSDYVALTGNSVLTVTEGDFANSFRDKSDYYVSQNPDGATHSVMLKTAFRLHIAVVDGEPRIGFFKDTASGAPTYTMKGTAELGAAAVWQDVNFDVADDASGASTLPLYWAKPTEGTSYRFFKLSATERSSAE